MLKRGEGEGAIRISSIMQMDINQTAERRANECFSKPPVFPIAALISSSLPVARKRRLVTRLRSQSRVFSAHVFLGC